MAGIKGTKRLSEKEFNNIKQLTTLIKQDKIIAEISKRSTTTISYVRRFTWEQYLGLKQKKIKQERLIIEPTSQEEKTTKIINASAELEMLVKIFNEVQTISNYMGEMLDKMPIVKSKYLEKK